MQNERWSVTGSDWYTRQIEAVPLIQRHGFKEGEFVRRGWWPSPVACIYGDILNGVFVHVTHTGGVCRSDAGAWNWQSEQSNHNQSTEALDHRWEAIFVGSGARRHGQRSKVTTRRMGHQIPMIILPPVYGPILPSLLVPICNRDSHHFKVSFTLCTFGELVSYHLWWYT